MIEVILRNKELRKYVQWIEGKDGGWRTGELVIIPNPLFDRDLPICLNGNHYLVKHSHTGELEWVADYKLEPRPMRNEFEQ